MRSERVVVGFARANADRALNAVDEDFSVADPVRLGRSADSGEDLVLKMVLNADFDFEFRHEGVGVFGAAINLGVALLPAEPFDLRNGHALDVERSEGIADIV